MNHTRSTYHNTQEVGRWFINHLTYKSFSLLMWFSPVSFTYIDCGSFGFSLLNGDFKVKGNHNRGADQKQKKCSFMKILGFWKMSTWANRRVASVKAGIFLLTHQLLLFEEDWRFDSGLIKQPTLPHDATAALYLSRRRPDLSKRRLLWLN